MMRLPFRFLRQAARYTTRQPTVRVIAARAIATHTTADDCIRMSQIEHLHQIIEKYRSQNCPTTPPHEFLDEVIEATDRARDGMISVDEMMVMLKNIDPNHPLDRDEVHFIMERDMDLDKDSNAVSIEKAKRVLHEINH